MNRWRAGLPFDADEYRSRLIRLRALMAREDLDAVLLFSQESLYYYFGYDQIGYWVYQTVVLIGNDEPITICRAADAHLVRESGLLQDVRVWLDEGQDPIEMTMDALRGPSTIRKLGVERNTHALLSAYYARLVDALPGGLEILDVSEPIMDLRLVKAPAEVDFCREAGKALSAAMDEAVSVIKVGARETDIEAAVMAALFASGAESPAIAPPIASGRRTLGQTHARATRKPLMHGDVVVVEIGASVNRYHVVGATTRIVGGPGDAEQQRFHAGLAAALDAGRELIGPGQPTAAIATAVQQELKRAGIDRAGRHVGYGTGIGFPSTWLDSLRLKTTDARLLLPGMVFFFFVGAVDANSQYAMYLGQPLLVTPRGYEVLARVPWTLAA
jgi:Xaa-Pro dipeptidase